MAFSPTGRAFAALYNALGLEHAMKACSPNLVADANCLKRIQRLAPSKGLPPTAIWEAAMPVGSALLTQASPPWRPHSHIQHFSQRIGSEPQPLFIQQVWPGMRVHPFKVLQGPSRRLWRKPSLSTRVVKYWNRLPTRIVAALSVNSFRRQLDSAWN